MREKEAAFFCFCSLSFKGEGWGEVIVIYFLFSSIISKYSLKSAQLLFFSNNKS
ncbi:hypothetical protein HOG27_01765 [bacterium]|nr:hypothetical protein [bacterium]